MIQNLASEMGARVKILREERHMTKEKFARVLGVSGQYLGMVEKGFSCLAIDKIIKVCEFTGASADYLIFGKERTIALNTKELIENFSDEQIKVGCETLSKLAIFIKNIA